MKKLHWKYSFKCCKAAINSHKLLNTCYVVSAKIRDWRIPQQLRGTLIDLLKVCSKSLQSSLHIVILSEPQKRWFEIEGN